MADNVVETTLRVSVDGAAAAQGQAALAGLKKSVEDIQAEADKTAKSLAKSVGAEGLRRTGGALSALGAGGVGSAFSGLGNLSEVKNEFAALSALLPQMAAGAVAAAGGIGAIALAAGPLAVAGVALAVAFKGFQDTLASSDTALKNATASLKTYYEAIATGTTASITTQITALEGVRDRAKAELANIEQAREAGGANAGANPGLLSLLSEGFRDQNARMDTLRKTIGDADNSLDGLNRSLDDTSVKARDAAKAAQSLFTDSQKAVQDFVQGQKDYRNELKATGEATKERINTIAQEKQELKAAIEIEKQNLQNSGAALSDENTKNLKAMREQLAALGVESERLITKVYPLVKLREDEAKASEQLTKDLTDAVKAMKDIGALQTDHAKQLADRAKADARSAIEADYAKRIDAAKEAEASATDIAKIQADYAKQQADIEKSYQQDSLKALQSYLLSEQRATDAYAKQRRRTLEDLNDSLVDLAAAGDVAGFIQAQKAGEKELKRQTEDADDAAKQRAQDFANQNRERRDQADQSLRQLKQDNQDKLQEERESHQRRVSQSQQLEDQFAALRLQWQQQDEQERRAAEDSAYATQLAELQKQMANQTLTVKNYWDNALQYGRQAVNSLKALFGFGATPQSNQGNSGAHPLASGLGFVPYDNYPAMLHRGETVLNANQANQYRSGGGGISIGSIVIGAGNNVTRGDIEQAMDRLYDHIAGEIGAVRG